MNMFFLWLIFLLFIAEIIYIAFFQREKPIKYRQVVVRSKDGKKIILTNKIPYIRW